MFRPVHAAYLAALVSVLMLAGCGAPEPPPVTAPPEAPPVEAPPVEAPPPQPAPVPQIQQAPLTPPTPVVQTPNYMGGKHDIALLLPLSGPNAAIGNDMLDAAQMAVMEMRDDALALSPKDTGGTPQGAAKAAQMALAEGAKLIIGPLTAAEAAAVKPVIQNSGVNVLSFSSEQEVAGDGVYVMGFMPGQEVRRVVAYAHATGAARFGVLAGSDAYGTLAVQALHDEAAADGATVTASANFQSNESDLAAQAQQIGGGAQPAFDALLLPEGGQVLSDVAAQLSALQLGLPRVRLLGTGLWDMAGLSGEPVLVGGWYAAPEPEARAGFESRFGADFGHTPPVIASLAYDAVALAAVLDRNKGGDFGTGALTDPNGFAGINGIFRFLPDGSNQRGLAVLQVGPSGSSVVSPAPMSFAPGVPGNAP